MVLSLIELTPISGNREKVLELLRFCVERLQTRPGCLGCGVYEGGDAKEAILYLERWESEKELHRHIQSNLYLGVLNAMDLAQAPRGISFYNVTDAKSMELIVAQRTSGVA